MAPEPDLIDAVASRAQSARGLAWVGIVGTAIACVLEIAMHLTPGGRSLDPLTNTISEYALIAGGWMFGIGVLLLSAASAAIGAALHRADLVRFRGGWAIWFVLWCAGLVGLTLISKTVFGPDHSVQGRIHWSFTLLAFIALPIALSILLRRRALAAAAIGSPLPVPLRVVAILTWISFGWFVLLVGQTVLGLLHQQGLFPWVGVIERGVAAAEIGAIFCLAVWVLRCSPPLAGRSAAEVSRAAPECST